MRPVPGLFNGLASVCIDRKAVPDKPSFEGLFFSVPGAVFDAAGVIARTIRYSWIVGVLSMRFLVWILRLIVFVLVLMFAMNNTGPVNVHFYADYMIPGVPLIVVMLAMLILGIVLALLATAPAAMRRRREAKKLKRDLGRLREQIKNSPASPTSGAVAPETIAPLAPL